MELVLVNNKRERKKENHHLNFSTCEWLSQIRYSLVVILELNGISEVQYKEVMIIDDE